MDRDLVIRQALLAHHYSTYNTRQTRWYTHIGDFMNTLKAFIGINYQNLPFAFAQCGLVFGLVGVFVIATLTNHCCQLLVSSKKLLIRRFCAAEVDNNPSMSREEKESVEEYLQRSVGYGDVGRWVFGEWCFKLIQVAVWLTQFIILIIYFVFIGSTIQLLFPQVPLNDTTHFTSHFSTQDYFTTPSPAQNYSDTHSPSHSGFTTHDDSITTSTAQNHSATQSSTHPDYTTQTPGDYYIPDLRLLVLFPLPFFILTSMVRNLRRLAPFSVIATVALVAGAVSVTAFMCYGFKVTEDYELIAHDFKTIPIFLTMIISAFEGIGCVLPIDSSMAGTRHLFPAYLRASVYVVLVILCTFGTLGYLRYGTHVAQIIVQEISQGSVLSILVDVTLIISVLFTYPLQCYPCIEITERFLFTSRGCGCCALTSCCCCCTTRHDEERERLIRNGGGASRQKEEPGDEYEPITSHPAEIEREATPRLHPHESQLNTEDQSKSALDEISWWKRSLTRLSLTLIVAGLAVMLRENLAYLASFSGCIGASLLALILPCCLDLKLRYHEMSRVCVIKDVSIIVFAFTCSVLGLAAIVNKVVHGLRP